MVSKGDKHNVWDESAVLGGQIGVDQAGKLACMGFTGMANEGVPWDRVSGGEIKINGPEGIPKDVPARQPGWRPGGSGIKVGGGEDGQREFLLEIFQSSGKVCNSPVGDGAF